ncbi:peptide/nickel transport system permease protein [Pedococcus dokdonensis]|uniref:Peptide/nickel transport system permease protein n=1 Tax=Pedococcus dokdonensis TaxID=443156 RepID=A0A1H0SK27_9MICO|nr:ABC transporter permease [Pedococcus dokdonensis]SDP42060.1 peptide/nickel transport system permease protein [Pedococcus dokdonensis]
MTAGVVQTGADERPGDGTDNQAPIGAGYTQQRWWQLIWGNGKARVGIFLLLGFVLVAVLAPLIAPYEGTRSDFEALLPPGGDHWLGTTTQGGDIFSQLVYGSRISLVVGLFGGLVSTAIALVIGMWSGYKEGTVVDDILSFFTNVAIVVPVLPLMIVLIAYSEVRGIPLIVFVIGITSWAGHARAKRSQIITLRNRDFVTAAKFAGEGSGRIIFREIMPSMTSLVAAGFVGASTGAIGAEAGLSFLGLGDPNTVSWGTMLYQANEQGAVGQGLWLWVLAPGLVLALLITSLTFINFGVDLLSNPHLRED